MGIIQPIIEPIIRPVISSIEGAGGSGPDDRPKNTAPPSIIGTVEIGETVEADTGTWENADSISYAWLIDGSPAGDPDDDLEIPDDPDLQLKAVTLVVTATNAHGSRIRTASQQIALTLPPINVTPPSISGTPEVGETLTATPGTWKFAASVSAEWEVDGTPTGDTGLTYVVDEADAGKEVAYVETATNSVGDTQADDSVEIPSSWSPVAATGGTESDIDVDGRLYRLHVFTSSGDFVVTDAGTDGEVERLIVGGGGGGAGHAAGGGGGGGGGEVSAGTSSVTATTYPLVVGGGGASAASGAVNGSNGSASSAFSSTAPGGGGGGRVFFAGSNGASGGGGGGGNPTSGGTASAGFAGGAGVTTPRHGGGGGGGGAVGANASAGAAGNGGAGAPSSITGTSVFYGGGGGGGAGSGGVAGGGGTGGGGAGKNFAGGVGGNGTANSGGGGGSADGNPGGNGGSGVVIIRYPLEAA